MQWFWIYKCDRTNSKDQTMDMLPFPDNTINQSMHQVSRVYFGENANIRIQYNTIPFGQETSTNL